MDTITITTDNSGFNIGETVDAIIPTGGMPKYRAAKVEILGVVTRKNAGKTERTTTKYKVLVKS